MKKPPRKAAFLGEAQHRRPQQTVPSFPILVTRTNSQPAFATGAARQQQRLQASTAHLRAASATGAVAASAQAYPWPQDPVWSAPVPNLGDCSLEQQQRISNALFDAVICMAVRQLADTRGSSAAAVLFELGAF